jgi:hypothetical protein
MNSRTAGISRVISSTSKLPTRTIQRARFGRRSESCRDVVVER